MAGKRPEKLPKDWLLIISEHVERLAAIKRFHSLKRTLNPTLNVVMHALRVSFFATLLCSFLERQGVTVDKLKAAEMGLMHDDLEVITGDFPSPEKKDPVRREKILRAERQAIRILDRRFRGVPRPVSYWELWKELSEKKSLESQVVDMADHIDGLGETICEVILGNNSFLGVLEEYRPVFEEFDRRYPWWRRIKGKWGLEEFPTKEKVLEIRRDESLAPAFYKIWIGITVGLTLGELARQKRMEETFAEIRAKEEGDTGA